MAHALAHHDQATSAAAQYQLRIWPLRMHFIEAILTLPVPLSGAEDALKASSRLRLPQCMPLSSMWMKVLLELNASTYTVAICLC